MSGDQTISHINEYRGSAEYLKRKKALRENKNLPLVIEFVKNAAARNMLPPPATKDWVVVFSSVIVRYMYLHEKPVRLVEMSDMLKRENVYQLYDNISSALFILCKLGLIKAIHRKGWSLTIEMVDILKEEGL